jgi:quercetin dioxygenase-like cupin family protein
MNTVAQATVPSRAETDTRVRLIRRADLPSLSTATVDGAEHQLGIVKDFRKHPELAEFLPPDGRLSMAWVHLGPDEELAIHLHPTASMIVVAHGTGTVSGDLEDQMREGDIVAVPPGCRHGFRGSRPSGFWALSIQFEGNGLYEDTGRPRATFEKAAGRERDPHPLYFTLLSRNEAMARDFIEHDPIRQWLDSEQRHDPRHRKQFFDAVQVFSRHFQRLLFTRSATTEDARYVELFREHMHEEYNHDKQLMEEVGRSDVWDPILEAVSNWFTWKMLTLDNAEKVVLVTLVMELSSDLVSRHALTTLPGYRYFDVHADADEGHKELGLPLLRHLEPDTYERLFRVQQEGWDMMRLLLSRVIELARA